MSLLPNLNLVLRFFLELCLLAALGTWGFGVEGNWVTRLAIGLGLPLLAAILWGLFVAPRARQRLGEPWRLALEMFLFSCGALCLSAVGRHTLGVVFLSLFIIHRLLYLAWHQSG
jgi:hypothetical protein